MRNAILRVILPLLLFISDREYDFPYADLPEGIVLSPEDNSIRFKISNMDYTLPYANVYEYKLEGEDKEWRQQTGLDEVEYKNLHSGHYVLNCVFRERKLWYVR